MLPPEAYQQVPKIAEHARQIRLSIIEMLTRAGSGHVGGSLGAADILAAIYFGGLFRYDANRPDWPERDRFILSNGHICPVLYATLAEAGFFAKDELGTLRQLNTRLQGHTHHFYRPLEEGEQGSGTLPGLENTSGSLGQAIGVAVGIAKGLKMQSMQREEPSSIGVSPRVICLTSDGEHQEGSTWEALLYAAHEKLDNLTVIVDRNALQIGGGTESILPLEPLREKYEAFLWQVIEVDGHNFYHLLDALGETKEIHGRPTVIIAHTTMGKGVSIFENNAHYHGLAPTADEAEVARQQLRAEPVHGGQYA